MYKRECSLFMRIQLGAIRIQSVVSRELEYVDLCTLGGVPHVFFPP
jgi:hypothetical protein